MKINKFNFNSLKYLLISFVLCFFSQNTHAQQIDTYFRDSTGYVFLWERSEINWRFYGSYLLTDSIIGFAGEFIDGKDVCLSKYTIGTLNTPYQLVSDKYLEGTGGQLPCLGEGGKYYTIIIKRGNSVLYKKVIQFSSLITGDKSEPMATATPFLFDGKNLSNVSPNHLYINEFSLNGAKRSEQKQLNPTESVEVCNSCLIIVSDRKGFLEKIKN